MTDVRLIIVDPGHFHAALVQQEMYPRVSPQTHVYAPLGPDLVDYLTRIARFNSRVERPTCWAAEIHASPDFLERLIRERPGTVAIFSGRNRGKIARVKAAIEAGINVLADKPLIIRREDLPVLEAALKAAEERQLVLCDMMGGRHEASAILTRHLREDPEVFGDPVAGTAAEPGVSITSVHNILKEVAGVPNPRPAWYFDIEEQGEGLADIGTHLVDRVHATLFPNQAIDYRTEIRLHSASRWPTMLSAAQFRQVTGEARWPDYLEPRLKGGALEYFCNTRLRYEVRRVHVTLEVRWEWQAAAGGDTQTAAYRGSRARLEIRQGAPENWRSELYVVPLAEIGGALERRIAALQDSHPGVGLEKRSGEWRVTIPDRLRIGHDAHFIQLTRGFLDHVEHPWLVPQWERPNLVAKYYVCTEGIAIARGEDRSRNEVSRSAIGAQTDHPAPLKR